MEGGEGWRGERGGGGRGVEGEEGWRGKRGGGGRGVEGGEESKERNNETTKEMKTDLEIERNTALPNKVMQVFAKVVGGTTHVYFTSVCVHHETSLRTLWLQAAIIGQAFVLCSSVLAVKHYAFLFLLCKHTDSSHILPYTHSATKP